MNNINFNYWLQGYFEVLNLSDLNQDKNIYSKQIECIREHIGLVKKSEQLAGFAAWLEGYLDAKVSPSGGTLKEDDYAVIAGKLTESFKHLTPITSFPPGFGQGGTIYPGPLSGVSYC